MKDKKMEKVIVEEDVDFTILNGDSNLLLESYNGSIAAFRPPGVADGCHTIFSGCCNTTCNCAVWG
jgi:hypothetical protein